MGYSTDPEMVRVDFWDKTGRWCTAEAVKWDQKYYYHTAKFNLYDAFAQVLREHFKDNPTRLSDMDAICMEHYHEYSHSIYLRCGSWCVED